MTKRMTQEEKTARAVQRKEEKRLAREAARIEEERNQKPVKALTISITWVRSRTWGMNPHAEAQVTFHDGTFERRDGFTCSGCGYDKESTVIAEIFNHYLRYKLWAHAAADLKRDETKRGRDVPYGISAGEYEHVQYRGYGGGIGTSCYYEIARFIGGTFEHVAGGKTFDVYRYVDGEKGGAECSG